MGPKQMVNTLLWLAVAPEAGNNRLRAEGFTEGWVEVPDAPGGQLPVDVLIVAPARGDAMATECKCGPNPKQSQHVNYCALKPDGITQSLGGAPEVQDVAPCYFVPAAEVAPLLVAQGDICNQNVAARSLPVLAGEVSGASTKIFRDPTSPVFQLGVLNVVFSVGLEAPYPPPVEYVDLYPDSPELELKRHVLRVLPVVLRLKSLDDSITASEVAARSRVWSYLPAEARTALAARIQPILAELSRRELNTWLKRSRTEAGRWNVYRGVDKPVAQRDLGEKLAKVRERWGVG